MLTTLEQLNAEQIVHVHTYGANTPDVVYAHIVGQETYVDISFEEIFDFLNNEPLAIENT